MESNIGKGIVIKVENVSKSFKLFYDKNYTLKERILFWKRNRYEIRKVLQNVSFEINKGDSVGLIGKNGCGKSTMLKMLTKIYYPNKGKITINGKVSSLIELGAGFHPDMSGRENIYINASIHGLSKEQIDNRIEKIIEFSELQEYIDNPIRTYSSGMYMRLAFAVAINVDADILLIDEILAVGDSNFQSKCFNQLLKLQKEGVTIVLVTHSMDSIRKFCNKCVWIENGTVMLAGKTNLVSDKYINYMTKRTIDRDNKVVSAKPVSLLTNEKKSLEIVYVKLYKNNNLIKAIQANDSIDIAIRYKTNQKYNNLIVGFAIKENDDKTIIYYTNSNLDNKQLKAYCNGTIVLHFDNFILQQGEYLLGVSLRDEMNTSLDTANLRLSVFSKINSSGKFILNHTWTSK